MRKILRRPLFLVLTLMLVSGCSKSSPQHRMPPSDVCVEAAIPRSFVAYYEDQSFRQLSAADLAAELKNQKTADVKIKWYEPNYRLHMRARPQQEAPDHTDPLFFGTELWNNLGVQRFYSEGYTGAGIVVAILDAGIYIPEHPLFHVFKNEKEIPGNKVDDDANGFIDDVSGWNMETHSPDQHVEVAHGTQIADIIAGSRQSPTGGGIAPGAAVLPVDFMGATGGTEADAVAAMDYAVRMKTRVINNSWTLRCSYLLQERYKAWESADVLIVNAAGNDGEFLKETSRSSSNFRSPNYLSVGSVDANGNRAFFSNYGPNVLLYAPGVQIQTLSDFLGSDVRAVEAHSGTSYSAAIVSGAAALVWSAHLDWRARDVRSYLLQQTIRKKDVMRLSL